MKDYRDKFLDSNYPLTAEDILTLPFKSTYRILVWYGTANGTILTQGFELDSIADKIPIIKSVKLVPYYGEDPGIDFYVTDGATDWEEIIPPLARIERVFDVFPGVCNLNCLINQAPVSMFSGLASGTSYFPIDLWVDNVYYKYPSPIQSWDFKITGGVFTSINNSSPVDINPNIKVIVECYLL